MEIEWIDVKKSLPRHNQRCLIWVKSPNTIPREYINIANFVKGKHSPNGPWSFGDTGLCGNSENPWGWDDCGHHYESQEVTHWARLSNKRT